MNAVATEHKVKLAVSTGRWYVVECTCGWSSALHYNSQRANDEYKNHRDTASR